MPRGLNGVPASFARGVFKRYQNEGHLHFLTFSTHGRAPILPDHFLTFEHSLEQTRRRYRLDVHGFVLMPEHVHLLVSEPATDPLSKAIQALKLSVSKQAPTQPFWQTRYYDFNVFSREKRLEKLLYMHQNPVTRGLVLEPQHWLHSSCRHYLSGEPHAVVRPPLPTPLPPRPRDPGHRSRAALALPQPSLPYPELTRLPCSPRAEVPPTSGYLFLILRRLCAKVRGGGVPASKLP